MKNYDNDKRQPREEAASCDGEKTGCENLHTNGTDKEERRFGTLPEDSNGSPDEMTRDEFYFIRLKLNEHFFFYLDEIRKLERNYFMDENKKHEQLKELNKKANYFTSLAQQVDEIYSNQKTTYEKSILAGRL